MRAWPVALYVVSSITLALADPAPTVSFDHARKILPNASAACTDVLCLLEDRYRSDAKAKPIALALYRDLGHVAGVGPEEIMDGGYRGKIRLVPQYPTGKHRKHLIWTHDAFRAIDDFFTRLYAKQTDAPSYRWRGLQLRFVRSVGKRTPSAYAMGWLVAYNVEGTLLTTPRGVLETMFHELFHSNDGAHKDWSARTLQADYDAIVKKCGATSLAKLAQLNRCLEPFAPNTTKVRGGTYYAFQPNNGNGVHEYAAELAVRYWKEHLQMLDQGKLAKPAFKCGGDENARSWKALVDEFFAGRDLVPAC
jgi:hypothetical protein